MIREPNLTETLDLVRIAHSGQTDMEGRPYVEHVEAVAALLPIGVPVDVFHAALLHDIIEDTPFTLRDLRVRGYSREVLDIVELVTRRPEKGTYLEWIRSIAASGNVGAIQVKLADNRHNSDPERLSRIADPVKRRSVEEMVERRYKKSIPILEETLDALVVKR